MDTIGELIEALNKYLPETPVVIVYETHAQRGVECVRLNEDYQLVQIVAEDN